MFRVTYGCFSYERSTHRDAHLGVCHFFFTVRSVFTDLAFERIYTCMPYSASVFKIEFNSFRILRSNFLVKAMKINNFRG